MTDDRRESGARTARGRSRRWSEDDLRAAVAECTHILDVLVALGLSPNAPTNRSRVLREIDDLVIDRSHWRSRHKSPGPRNSLDDVMIEGSSYSTTELGKRLVREGVKERKCEGCQLVTWVGQPIPLELDHVNGIPNDHRLENLRLLCPNCHALTPTWRGRNRRVGRRPENHCATCGVGGIAQASTLCRSCSSSATGRSRYATAWPDHGMLLRMVEETSAEAVGRILGVSGAAVRKRLKKCVRRVERVPQEST